jgi:hypothetical protein
VQPFGAPGALQRVSFEVDESRPAARFTAPSSSKESAASASARAAICARPRARRGCLYATCGRGTTCMRASQASATGTIASAPRSMAGRSDRAVVGAVREAAACERAGCVSRCACDLHRAVGGQRPRAHVASFCAIVSSASSESPVVGHHSGRRRAGAAHATDVHPPATAAYAIAAAAAVPPLPPQPSPPTPAAGAQCWARADSPQVVSPDISRPLRRLTCLALY